MKTLAIIVALLVASTTANASTTENKIKNLIASTKSAEVAVSKGVYVNDNGDRVGKPTNEICAMYKSPTNLFKYTDKQGWSVGSFQHKLIVTRRGC